MYKTKNHSKYNLNVHLVFVVKYRHQLLIKLGSRCTELVYDICKRKNYDVLACETDKNHIHILISYEPNTSVNQIVKDIKQFTSYHLQNEYNSYIRNYIWNKTVFWSKGYFVCSTGDASKEVIMTYIQNQG